MPTSELKDAHRVIRKLVSILDKLTPPGQCLDDFRDDQKTVIYTAFKSSDYNKRIADAQTKEQLFHGGKNHATYL